MNNTARANQHFIIYSFIIAGVSFLVGAYAQSRVPAQGDHAYTTKVCQTSLGAVPCILIPCEEYAYLLNHVEDME